MNRKAIGFFKCELNSVPMQLFVALRPKVSNNMLQHTSPEEKSTAKGIKNWAKDAHLHFAYYLDAHNNFHREPDQVYPAHCAHSSHLQGRLDNI